MINTIKIFKLTMTLLILFCTVSYADTIYLKDGSIITGKIIKNYKTHYIFANSHGIFNIKKNLIRNEYITNNFGEDINIHKKLGFKINKEKIAKEYKAGMKAKKRRRRIKSDDWNYGRISFSFAYFSTILSGNESKIGVNKALPAGIGVNLAYDQGLEFLRLFTCLKPSKNFFHVIY